MTDRDIVDGGIPGGANTSHTIAIDLLRRLLAAVPSGGGRDDYVKAAVDANVLGRTTVEGRKRSLRYLRELYLLDPGRLLFRALRDLWDEDPASQPLLAGLCALARDAAFRASASAVLRAPAGTAVTSDDLTHAVVAAFPGVYNDSTAAKIGRNSGSSWTQTGHLKGRTGKTRQLVTPTPASVTYAMLLGHLQGVRGQALFLTPWAVVLDADRRDFEGLAEAASRRGYLELKSGGGVVEVGFRHLLRAGTGGDPT